MRVIFLIKATGNSEAGIMPSAWFIEAMWSHNREPVDAGIMRVGERIQPAPQGVRVVFDGE